MSLSEITYVRLPPDAKEALIREAGRLTLQEGKQITTSEVLRRAFELYQDVRNTNGEDLDPVYGSPPYPKHE